ncbi:MAG: hypothetical protein H0T69_01865 [Thermoleophilaceae bacterium]|nr:hypothetical protein [Thermoleophilaceae bacterium]
MRAERELVAGAERELKATGGWERWSVEKIEAAGPDDLVVYTGLYPDAEAYPAATGICTTLRNPASTRIKVDLVQVLGSNGDEVEPPACECEYGGDPSDPISVAKASASQAYVPASTAPPLDALVAVASRPA